MLIRLIFEGLDDINLNRTYREGESAVDFPRYMKYSGVPDRWLGSRL